MYVCACVRVCVCVCVCVRVCAPCHKDHNAVNQVVLAEVDWVAMAIGTGGVASHTGTLKCKQQLSYGEREVARQRELTST